MCSFLIFILHGMKSSIGQTTTTKQQQNPKHPPPQIETNYEKENNVRNTQNINSNYPPTLKTTTTPQQQQ